MPTLTVEQFREMIANVDGELELRFENANGELIGNDVLEAYRFNGHLEGAAGERLYVIAVALVEPEVTT